MHRFIPFFHSTDEVHSDSLCKATPGGLLSSTGPTFTCSPCGPVITVCDYTVSHPLAHRSAQSPQKDPKMVAGPEDTAAAKGSS